MKNLTSSEYTKLMADKGLSLIDFWAPWCGPCLSMNPTLERLSEEFSGKASIVKVNVDEEVEIAQQVGIRAIPFLVLVKDGKVVDQFIGAQKADILRASINKHL